VEYWKTGFQNWATKSIINIVDYRLFDDACQTSILFDFSQGTSSKLNYQYQNLRFGFSCKPIIPPIQRSSIPNGTT